MDWAGPAGPGTRMGRIRGTAGPGRRAHGGWGGGHGGRAGLQAHSDLEGAGGGSGAGAAGAPTGPGGSSGRYPTISFFIQYIPYILKSRTSGYLPRITLRYHRMSLD